MKNSIKRQISVTFIGLILLALLAIELCNLFFMQDFYLNQKSKILLQGMGLLNQMQDINSIEELNNSDFIDFCRTNNLAMVTTNRANTTLYWANIQKVDADMLTGRLFGYLTGVTKASPEVLQKNSQYIIQISRELDNDRDYIEIWGVLDDGRNFIFQTPLESIRDSVAVSNRFFLYIGAGVALISALFIWHFSKRITTPLTELTKLSQRMADLDFEAKYESGGNDEIGILGQNLNRVSETLLATLSELKSANNELQKDLEHKNQIDEMRREFLSNVSHELKTPIALIQGYAEGLQDNINEDAGEREFYCEVIIDEAAKMNTMVKKLLSLNQLEFGNDQVCMERFDLTALISGVVQSSSILIQQKEVEVIFWQDEPLYVWGDEFKVEEVITNFFSNALNHVDYDKKIEIHCKEEDGMVYTSVFNTGDPIPEPDLDKVWIKFYKVDKARTRAYGGSGIGLSIVKAIMDSMNQSCGVRNYENGVEFWFTLERKR